MAVNEVAHLRLVSHHGGLLIEEGASSGTPGGQLTIHVNISYTRATVSFSARPAGGTLTGRGEVAFYASGTTAHFNGTVSLTGRSGRYAHASTRGFNIQGTVQRNHNYAITVQITGTMHL